MAIGLNAIPARRLAAARPHPAIPARRLAAARPHPAVPARRLAAARPHPGPASRIRWWSPTDRVAITVQRLGAWREQRPQLDRPPGPVLAIGAHPDDESLAFGGTLARLVEAGASVHVLCATAGEASRAGPRPSRLGPRRREELNIACEWLGVSDVECLGLPDGRLSARLDQLTQMLAQRIHTLQPAAILLPWWRA